ncbi:hypothetical protein HPP92_005337 [Vanilla planifolia]|uniref:Uncharacterized protein n=1 Tax=Vanilla planifolia TaxID=51239 RepID=A0A835RYK5_VANPL|nr:hypothetical protein HPP92_005337 [Vanilla planifolia]
MVSSSVKPVESSSEEYFYRKSGVQTCNRSLFEAKVRDHGAAFWDRIMESMEEIILTMFPLIELVKEVRDRLSEMSPLSWKQDIHDSIDVDILSQVMESGTHDVGYLGKILEFALLKLLKLSAPANEDNLKMSHEKLMNELASIAQSDGKQKRSLVTAMIKGLRFVLEQIQVFRCFLIF